MIDYIDKIIKGDAVEEMKKFPNNSVPLIVCDPPYWGMKDELLDSNIKTFEDYLIWYEKWLKEAYRVLTDDGSLYVFIPPLEFAETHLLIKKYFHQRQIISWIKPNVMIRQPTTRNYFPKVEFVGFYVKSDKFTWNRLIKKYGIQKSCNFDVESTIYKHRGEGTDHPTQKPLKLCAKFIYASSNENDIVLDPFCGSGTSCAAAKVLNRRFIGIEVKSKYCRISESRVGQTNLKDIFESKPNNALF
jgi:site-specific DNA-methyltransferase (adenine-specific)